MFGAIKRWAANRDEDGSKAGPKAGDAAAEAEVVDAPALHVTHALEHTVKDVKALAWDATRSLLVISTVDTVWVVGQGWGQRRFRVIGEDEVVVSLHVMRLRPCAVLCTSHRLRIIDYDEGLVYLNTAVPSRFTFTAATSLVSETWVLVGRSDGVVQGLDASASRTQCEFNAAELCRHPSALDTASKAITVLLSRMFHKQIVILHSEMTGLCQFNFARKELLNRFALPKDAEMASATMCAIDKYLLVGLKDGRISLWKANDEPRNKRTYELPPMLVVPALTHAPVKSIECYGSGTEDIIPCRWITPDRMVEAVLRPKEKMPQAVAVDVVHESQQAFGSAMCGLVSTPWPERAELPSQVVVVDEADSTLQVLVQDEEAVKRFHPAHLTHLSAQSHITATVIVPSHRPDLLAHSIRSNVFPWRAGGRSQFAGDMQSASLVLGCGRDGSLTVLKALLDKDAIAPYLLRAFDTCNAAAIGNEAVSVPGSLTASPSGDVLLSCSGGLLHRVDMITLNATPVPTDGHLATCACMVGHPVTRLFVGTTEGKLLVIAAGQEKLVYAVEGAEGLPVSSVSVSCVARGCWAVNVMFVNKLGATEVAVVAFDPEAPHDAMLRPEEPLVSAEPPPEEPAATPSPPVALRLPPRPLRSMGVYTLSSQAASEEGAVVPRVHCVTEASSVVSVEKPVPGDATSEAASRTVVLDAPPRVKALYAPPTNTEHVVVLRLADAAFDEGGKVSVALRDSSGHDAVVAEAERVEKPGHVKVRVSWLDAPYGGDDAESVQTAEADEVPLCPGEDTVLAVRAGFDGEMFVATLSSVEAAKAPSDRDLARALQRYAARGEMVGGGPMWTMKSVTPLVCINTKEVCRKYSIASAVCTSGASGVKAVQLFDDISCPDAPEEVVVACVRSDDDVAKSVPQQSANHTAKALVFVASTGAVHHAVQGYQAGVRCTIGLNLSPPLKIGGRVIASSYVCITNSQEPLLFVIEKDTLYVVSALSMAEGEATPLLQFVTPKLQGLSIDVQEGSTGKLHVVGLGGRSDMLHLIISPEPQGYVMYDVCEANNKHTPLKHLSPVPPRPHVKAPGMGLITMKGMFKNHDKEVAAVEESFAKTVEESFDAFTDRVLPEDQKRKMQYDIEQKRKELLADAQADEAKPQQSGPSAVSGSVNEVKDQMNKNKMLLNERGEKINDLADNTKIIAEESQKFADTLKEYNKRQAQKKWWQL